MENTANFYNIRFGAKGRHVSPNKSKKLQLFFLLVAAQLLKAKLTDTVRKTALGDIKNYGATPSRTAATANKNEIPQPFNRLVQKIKQINPELADAGFEVALQPVEATPSQLSNDDICRLFASLQRCPRYAQPEESAPPTPVEPPIDDILEIVPQIPELDEFPPWPLIDHGVNGGNRRKTAPATTGSPNNAEQSHLDISFNSFDICDVDGPVYKPMMF